MYEVQHKKTEKIYALKYIDFTDNCKLFFPFIILFSEIGDNDHRNLQRVKRFEEFETSKYHIIAQDFSTQDRYCTDNGIVRRGRTEKFDLGTKWPFRI